VSIGENIAKHVSLKGQVATITGAASGIGRASAILLADAGASIAVLDIDEAKGQEIADEITRAGGTSDFFPCDVRLDQHCHRALENTIKKFGKIDILFNNVGIIIRKDTKGLTEEEWDTVLDVNLKSSFLLSRHVIPHMIQNGGGSIINMGSGWSLRGGPKAVSYCAAKGGILNLTRAMAIDHGRHNIRVNCICPGDIDTPLLRNEAAQLGKDVNSFLQEAADRPLQRIGQPEDVAKAVLFFASDLSSWVTGAYLVVDGGGLA
jgi:NAD(P)-dependent dehydrogenase (short-subunit alcohol dehydrogenase family)